MRGFVFERDQRARDPVIVARRFFNAVFKVCDGRVLIHILEMQVLAAERRAECPPVVGMDTFLHEFHTALAVVLAPGEPGRGSPAHVFGQHEIVREIHLNEHFAHGLECPAVLPLHGDAAVLDDLLFRIVDNDANIFRDTVGVDRQPGTFHHPAG